MKRIYPSRLPSFRDPAGRLIDAEGRILRWISPDHRDEFEAVAASSVVLKAIKHGQIVSYCVLHPSEARQLAERYELTESEVTDRGELVLEHERESPCT